MSRRRGLGSQHWVAWGRSTDRMPRLGPRLSVSGIVDGLEGDLAKFIHYLEVGRHDVPRHEQREIIETFQKMVGLPTT